MSDAGFLHIIDLGESDAEAESEAQLVEQDLDPAAARPRMFVLFEVIYALVPITRQFIGRMDRGSPRSWDWISAVPPS